MNEDDKGLDDEEEEEPEEDGSMPATSTTGIPLKVRNALTGCAGKGTLTH